MGNYDIQNCSGTAYCQDGTYAYSISLKSQTDQGAGDDQAVTGIALGCNDKTTGAFVHWAVPGRSASAPGDWDNCKNGTNRDVDVNCPTWGAWIPTNGCQRNTVVCGVSDKTETATALADKAGLTGVKLQCCSF